jgi:hypothetical protein
MKINPDIKGVWFLGGLLQSVIYAIVYLIIELLFLRKASFYGSYIGLVSGVIVIVGLTLSILLPRYYYESFNFFVEDDELYIKRGIFTITTTMVPYSRLQHIDVEQSIFDRMFGLSKVVLHTAGSKNDNLTIPGLPTEFAEELRDKLKAEIKEDVV